MSEYYLDIETYSSGKEPDPETDEIITIQYQRLRTETGEKNGPLIILKSWESSEKEILSKFLEVFKPDDSFDMFPIGTNLDFEFQFIIERAKKVLGISIDSKRLYMKKAKIDIKSILIMLNGGYLKGAKLSTFSSKIHDGNKIKEWYENKDYGSIENYILNETDAFIELYIKLKKNIKKLLE